MLPRLFEIPLGFTTLPIHTYGLMVLAGFLSGLWVAGRRAPSRGVSPELVTDLCVWLLLGGLAGSRLAYVLFYNRYDPVVMRWEFDWGLFDLLDGGLHPAGAVAGFVLVPLAAWWRSRRRKGGSPAEGAQDAPPPFPPRSRKGRLGLGALALLGGVVGARALHVGLNVSRYNFKLFAIWEGGIVFYGGLLGALAVGLIFLRRRRAPVLTTSDLIAPSVALGAAFGRIGCFLKGCCFGGVAEGLPWAVRFPRIVETVVRDGRAVQEVTGSPAFLHHRHACPLQVGPEATHSLPVHPTQLYEAAAMVVLFLLLSWYGSKRPRPGRVLASLGAGYGLWRFGLEFLRGDWHPHAVGLTLSQIVSLGVVAASVVLWLVVPAEGGPREGAAEKAS